MRLRLNISLKPYKHAALILGLEGVEPRDRGDFLCDLAAQAMAANLDHSKGRPITAQSVQSGSAGDPSIGSPQLSLNDLVTAFGPPKR